MLLLNTRIKKSSFFLFVFIAAVSTTLIQKGSCFVSTTTSVGNIKQTWNNGQEMSIKRRHQLFANVEDELEDLDKARSEFENMLQKQGGTEQLFQEEKKIPLCKEDYIPVITSSCLRRREVEMELIESLLKSNDAVDELVSLWLVERDYKSAMELQKMEEFCSPGLVEEEWHLRGMIEEYGVDWAEPMARLATILFYQGRSEESMYWCKVTLAVKPWHFETVHTMVMNCLRHQDFAGAIRWARKKLPIADRPKKRAEWVKQALIDAQDVINRGKQAEADKQLAATKADNAASEVWQ